MILSIAAIASGRHPSLLRPSDGRPAAHEEPELRMIGYWWDGDHERRWPDVRDFVDPERHEDERELTARWVRHGLVSRSRMGTARCRFCEAPNGYRELTDGVYLWPEGLAHDVVDPDVRLPETFVRHVQLMRADVEQAERSSSWWTQQIRT